MKYRSENRPAALLAQCGGGLQSTLNEDHEDHIMATKNQWTLAELEAIVSVEQGGGDAPSRLHPGVNTSYNPPPRERDIRRVIWDYIYSADGWVSRAQIAAALKLKKTNWLIGKIEGLVTEGYLVRETTVRANGMTMIWYAVPKGGQ